MITVVHVKLVTNIFVGSFYRNIDAFNEGGDPEIEFSTIHRMNMLDMIALYPDAHVIATMDTINALFYRRLV